MGMLKTCERLGANLNIYFGCLEAGQNVYILFLPLEISVYRSVSRFWCFSSIFPIKLDYSDCGNISTHRYYLQNKTTGSLFPQKKTICLQTQIEFWHWIKTMRCTYASIFICDKSDRRLSPFSSSLCVCCRVGLLMNFETRWQTFSFKISIRSVPERCSQNCNLNHSKCEEKIENFSVLICPNFSIFSGIFHI